MRYLKFLMLLLVTLSLPAWALEVQSLPAGWNYGDAAAGSLEEKLTGAQGALSLTEGGQTVATVLVFQKTAAKQFAPGENIAAWRKELFPEMAPGKFIILHDDVLRVKGKDRYLGEYTSDTGTENMLQTFIMAQIHNGKIVVFRYENHRRVYQTYSPKVDRLLRVLTLP